MRQCFPNSALQFAIIVSVGVLLCSCNGAINYSGVPRCFSPSTLSLLAKSSAVACSGLVDYEFYLPSNNTADGLNEWAIDLLSDAAFGIVQQSCKVAIKKAVCARVYLKCPNGFVATNNATWPTIDFTTASSGLVKTHVPFQRPCQSVCEAVQSSCSALDAFATASSWLDCGSWRSNDYLADFVGVSDVEYYPLTYNGSDSSSTCNNMSTVASVEVAASMEIYDGSACSGIVSDVFIPPSQLVTGLNLAPMQPPGVVRSLLEANLVSAFAALPVWTSSSCHLAYRKYHCSTNLTAAVGTTLATAFTAAGITYTGSMTAMDLAHEFYLPQYTDQSICLEYVSHCKSFLVKTGRTVPQCGSTTQAATLQSDGSLPVPLLFPTTSQVVMRLGLSESVVTGTSSHPKYLNMSTGTNTLATVVNKSGFITQCPWGTVVPDDPTHPRVTMLGGTGCAAACRSGLFTKKQYVTMDTIVSVTLAVGFPLICIVFMVLLADKSRRKKQYLVVMFIFTAMMLGFVMIVAQAVSNPITRFCVNNAVPRYQSDGVSPCIVEAVGISYFLMANTLSWLCLSFDLFVKLVLEWRHLDLFYFHAAFIFGAPVIPLMVVTVRGALGYNGNQPWCFHRSGIDIKFTWEVFHLYLLVATCLGTVVMAPVVYKIIATTSQSAATSGTSGGVSGGTGSESAGTTTHSGRSFSTVSSSWRSPAFALAKAAKESAMWKKVRHSFDVMMKKIKPVRTSLIFVAEKLFLMTCLLYYRGLLFFKTDAYTADYSVWRACVFKHYDGSDVSYVNACGERPINDPIPYDPTLLAVFTVSGVPLFLAIVFMTTIVTWLKSVVAFVMFGIQNKTLFNPMHTNGHSLKGRNRSSFSSSKSAASDVADEQHSAVNACARPKPHSQHGGSSHGSHGHGRNNLTRSSFGSFIQHTNQIVASLSWSNTHHDGDDGTTTPRYHTNRVAVSVSIATAAAAAAAARALEAESEVVASEFVGGGYYDGSNNNNNNRNNNRNNTHLNDAAAAAALDRSDSYKIGGGGGWCSDGGVGVSVKGGGGGVGVSVKGGDGGVGVSVKGGDGGVGVSVKGSDRVFFGENTGGCPGDTGTGSVVLGISEGVDDTVAAFTSVDNYDKDNYTDV